MVNFLKIYQLGVLAQLAEWTLPISKNLRFESSHWQIFIMNIFSVNCWKRRNKDQRCRGWHIFKMVIQRGSFLTGICSGFLSQFSIFCIVVSRCKSKRVYFWNRSILLHPKINDTNSLVERARLFRLQTFYGLKQIKSALIKLCQRLHKKQRIHHFRYIVKPHPMASQYLHILNVGRMPRRLILH